VTVLGGDAEIAAEVRARPGARLGLDPGGHSDIARAVGLGHHEAAGTTDLPMDAIDVDGGMVVVNALVLGVAPERLRWWHRRRPVVVRVDGREVFDGVATTVVVATGQYLRGADVVPRGHPGDGRIEVQVHALDPGQRAGMRRRMVTGAHVPHPGIVQAGGRRVEVSAPGGWPLEVDGCARGARSGLTATVRAGAWRLVV